MICAIVIIDKFQQIHTQQNTLLLKVLERRENFTKTLVVIYAELIVVGWGAVLKLAAFAAGVMVALQLIFYVVFELIGYDSYLLSLTLIVSIVVAIVFLVLWNTAKKRL